MTRAELKGEAKELLKGKVWKVFWFMLVVTAVIPAIISLLSGVVGAATGTTYSSEGACDKAYSDMGIEAKVATPDGKTVSYCEYYLNKETGEVLIPNMMVTTVFSVISFIVEAVLTYGLISELLKFTRKKGDPKIGDAYSAGFANWARATWATIRVAVFTFLWSLLFVIPGIIKGLAYSQTMLVLADNPKMTAKEAQAKSIELMNGHKMDYFKLGLSFIPWLLLVCFTLGIASIYVMPYMETTMVNFYKELSGKKK